MTLISVLPAAMAAITLFVGAWHLMVYVRGAREPEHFWFALACFAIGLYDVCCAGGYATADPNASALWQRGQFLAMALFVPTFVWFLLSYTRQKLPVAAPAATLYYSVQAVLLLTVWNDWVFVPEPHATIVHLPWGDPIVYSELRHGILLRLQGWVSLGFVAVGVALVVRYVRGATRAEWSRAIPLAAALLVFLAGATNDVLVGNGVYAFLYVLEYAYLVLVLVMTLSMSTAVLELTRARAEIKRSHDRMQRMFESVHDVYAEIAMDGTILEITPSVDRFHGLNRSGLLGHSIREFYADPERREAYLNELRDHGQVEGFEIDVRLPNGDVRTTSVNARVVTADEDGKPRIATSIRDITEQKRAAAEHEKLEQQIQHTQKLESLGVLAGGIAHDFNNLLTGIVGSADLAGLTLTGDHPAQGHLSIVREASQRATELCQQMLAYSGRSSFKVESVNLSRMAAKMGGLLRVSVSKQVQLALHLADDLPAVEADAVQVRQILLNLVVNASEAMGEQGGQLEVTTNVRQCTPADLDSPYVDYALPGGEYVFLRVSDTGCGMDQETLARLFDPFFSTKFAGRGLGLAAVLGIVRGHSGSIRVDSAVGRGTTFEVLLPASDRRTAPSSRPSQCANWCGRGRVLLVDDETHVREVGALMLEQLGFKVHAVDGGRSAIAAFREDADAFSLAIVDVTMPDMNGGQVFRELRKIRPDMKVVLASGHSQQEITAQFSGEGLAGILQKPFTLETLRNKLEAALQ